MKIWKVGCDLDLLKQACCCDMAPQGSQEHTNQVNVNQKWAAASNGMMAPVTGEERFISLAASHTYAAFRAADVGCKTPYKDIQDKGGNMDKALLSNDNNMATMFDQGVEVFVMPYWLEQDVPAWPALVQRAHNAHHGIQSVVNEIEAAAGMVEDVMMQASDDPDWKAALHAIEATEPPCAPYLGAVLKLVQVHGGGHKKGFPLIVFASEFAQVFGIKLLLGEEFCTALAEAEDKNATQDLSHLKIACWLCQMASTEKKQKMGLPGPLSSATLDS